MSAGKGDKRRPSQVSEQELEHKWQRTFGTPRRRQHELPYGQITVGEYRLRSAAGSVDAHSSRGCDTARGG